jgi:aromatic-L-amino-acid/L-tryptophan decarboxylase
MIDQPCTEDFEDFCHVGCDAIAWIAEYQRTIRGRKVLPSMAPGDLLAVLPKSAPKYGNALHSIFEDFIRIVENYSTHCNHPRYFGYFSSSAGPAAILADLLASGLNANLMLWRTSPAATEIEERVAEWLREWLGLPDTWRGISYEGGSISALHALAAARHRIEPEAAERGGPGRLTVFASEQAHSSVEKAAILLGIGRSRVRRVPVDAAQRMRPDALAAAITRDRQDGFVPCCVVATAGTTASDAIDPLAEIAAVTEREKVWLHIDAAHAGAMAIIPELRSHLAGIDRADSIVINPHKSLFVPLDLSFLYTPHAALLRETFTLVPDYLHTHESHVNLMDFGLPLGRRFRVLKLWFTMRALGQQGIQRLIRHHIDLAQRLESTIREDDRFELAAPVSFTTVCFRYRGTEEDNEAIMRKMLADRGCFVSSAQIGGRLAIRIAIGNYQTEWSDVEECWRLIQRFTPCFDNPVAVEGVRERDAIQ